MRTGLILSPGSGPAGARAERWKAEPCCALCNQGVLQRTTGWGTADPVRRVGSDLVAPAPLTVPGSRPTSTSPTSVSGSDQSSHLLPSGCPPGPVRRPSGRTPPSAGSTPTSGSWAPGSSCCARCRGQALTSPTCPRARTSTGPARGPVSTSPTGFEPLADVLRAMGAFAVKMGPVAAVRRWHADTLKDAIAAGTALRLRDVEPDESFPDALRRRRPAARPRLEPEGRHRCRLRRRPAALRVPGPARRAHRGRPADGFNQLWRRTSRRREGRRRGRGRHVRTTSRPSTRSTSRPRSRDRFTPRGLAYFQRMYRAMKAEDENRIRLYLARHEGRVLAATTMVRVGTHSWYSYGASSNEGRDVRPSNAIQWAMIATRSPTAARSTTWRHQRHPRPRRPPVRADPVQARHRWPRPGVLGEWEPAAAPAELSRAVDATCRAAEHPPPARVGSRPARLDA